MNMIEVKFKVTPYSEDICDALIAALGNIGYEGFTYADNGFAGYINAQAFTPEAIRQLEILDMLEENFHISWECQEMEDRDWNKIWEENFTPILIENQILVRAGFHRPIPGIPYEILIEPKMSFGTGHHSTTALMLQSILAHAPQIKGRRVLDMGCGTGILSIMASKIGAKEVTGIDIDEWAYQNAMENIRHNQLENISVKIGDASLLQMESPFDVILANINRNILLNDMHRYTQCLNPGGLLILSGFYLKDLPMIRNKGEESSLTFQNYKEEKEWVAASFYKN